MDKNIVAVNMQIIFKLKEPTESIRKIAEVLESYGFQVVDNLFESEYHPTVIIEEK